ncbi:unnamed protein product [Nippostrongylus brasiliensis]|uniref:Uncharacterized protein n=1 Tax=Nippostrongylus brasiliensis TaxID=27835 RepID=A0A0N4XLC2_NIPBR|nr:unnamed protein product [Nippostrongylus brasiliensis]
MGSNPACGSLRPIGSGAAASVGDGNVLVLKNSWKENMQKIWQWIRDRKTNTIRKWRSSLVRRSESDDLQKNGKRVGKSSREKSFCLTFVICTFDRFFCSASFYFSPQKSIFIMSNSHFSSKSRGR